MAIQRSSESLQRQTLYTIKQHKAFTIVDVSNDRISFVPKAGKGTVRWEYRSGIDQLVNLKSRLGKLDVTDVRGEFPDSRITSYMAAIVDALTHSEK